jgi:hypothetical protein
MNDIKNMIKYWKYICQSGEQPIKKKTNKKEVRSVEENMD